jgi:hypothetical protein
VRPQSDGRAQAAPSSRGNRHRCRATSAALLRCGLSIVVLLAVVGYFFGPIAGGFVAQTMGYQAIGFVPLLGTIPRSHTRSRPR